jgi:hypothetical protein
MGKFIGGTSIPYMNAVADWFTRFPQTDSDVNKSTIYVYPGQGFCKINEAHAVWHEVSANGLLDLVYVCDLVNGFIHY